MTAPEVTEPHSLLRDRVVLISGGTAGLGAGIARAAAIQGALVAVTGGRREPGEALAAELTEGATKALFTQADAGDVAQARASVAAVIAAFGRVDSLVNAARAHRPGHAGGHHAGTVRRAHRGEPEGSVLPHAGRGRQPGRPQSLRHHRQHHEHLGACASPIWPLTSRPRPGWPG